MLQIITLEPLEKQFPFLVRYLTTNGNSTCCSCKSPFALSEVRAALAWQGVTKKQCRVARPIVILYYGSNTEPAKTEIPLVPSARPLSVVLDNVGDIGQPIGGIPFERMTMKTYPSWRGIANDRMEDFMATRKRELTVMHPNAAGIDIGSLSHYVAVSPDHGEDAVRVFSISLGGTVLEGAGRAMLLTGNWKADKKPSRPLHAMRSHSVR